MANVGGVSSFVRGHASLSKCTANSESEQLRVAAEIGPTAAQSPDQSHV